MKDKSQIEDMRAAIRGDLDRSRARGQSGGLLDAEPEIEVEPESSLPEEPEPGPGAEQEQEPLAAANGMRSGFFGSLFRRRS